MEILNFCSSLPHIWFNFKVECSLYSPVDRDGDLAKCGYNHFFAFLHGIWFLDEKSAVWENDTRLAFSESKMAAKMAADMTEIHFFAITFVII